MRIGFVIYGSLDQPTGGYLYNHKVIEYLQAQGDRIELISLPWRNTAAHLSDNLSFRLLRRLSNLQIDLLIEDELNHPSLFGINWFLRRKVPYPLVSIVHHLRSSEADLGWAKSLYLLIERFFLKSLHGIVCNSQTTERTVKALLGSENENDIPTLIAYPGKDHLAGGVDEAEIERRAGDERCLRLIFLGSLIPRKGAHWLLAALQRMDDFPFQLDLVGDAHRQPVYARRLQDMVNQSTLQNNVRFWGNVDRETLQRLLREAHVLVVPSSYEGFGIAYLDGMRYGLAVIGARQGGAAELISEGVEGYLVDPGDITALVNRLQQLHDDRKRLAEMGIAARRRFEGHPTWAQSAAQIRQFFLALLERMKTPE